ncbi:MAG: antitoxin Xre/MbcA/ParS toxin-binding domain-containing protein [Marinirhabdus sp.]
MKPKMVSKNRTRESDFFDALNTIVRPEVENHKEPYRNKGVIGVKKRGRRTIPQGVGVGGTFDRGFSHTPIGTIEAVRNGVAHKDYRTVYDLLNFSNKKWAEILGVTEKTVQVILKEEKPLKQKIAEKFISFLLLVKYGIGVFGSQQSFNEWLKYKTYNLDNKAPIDYLDTVQGIAMLKEQIFKIETGNLV